MALSTIYFAEMTLSAAYFVEIALFAADLGEIAPFGVDFCKVVMCSGDLNEKAFFAILPRLAFVMSLASFYL